MIGSLQGPPPIQRRRARPRRSTERGERLEEEPQSPTESVPTSKNGQSWPGNRPDTFVVCFLDTLAASAAFSASGMAPSNNYMISLQE